MSKALSTTALAKPDDLTAKQELFAQHLAQFGSVVEAYIHAYAVSPKTNRNSLRSSAHNVANHPRVRARVAALQAAASEGAVLSNAQLIAALEEMVEADVDELMTLTTGCCRYCHGGHGHRYQWKDADEYAMACAKALDAGELPPLDDGGYGFRNDRAPHGDCTECHGVGIPRVRFSNSSDVSRGVRRLLKGVELHADGSVKRLHLHDQSALRIELHRLRGMHVDRSINVNANVEVPTLRDMSREECHAFLESLKPA